MDWKATLDEILAERRKELGDPPSADDMIALRAGELSDAERSALLEHAAVDPEVARELFGVLRFPEPGDDEVGESDEDGVGERWRALRERLRAEGDLPVKTSAPRRVAWLPLAAMFVLGVGLSLLVGRLRDGDPVAGARIAAPRINLSIVELLPVGDEVSGPRGAPEVVTVAAGAGGLVLALAVPDLAPERGPFRLELTRGDGTASTVEGLTPGAGGVFMLDLPREDLTGGRHQLRLLDREGRPVASFELEVELRR